MLGVLELKKLVLMLGVLELKKLILMLGVLMLGVLKCKGLDL
jgi:hypothetical protein